MLRSAARRGSAAGECQANARSGFNPHHGVRGDALGLRDSTRQWQRKKSARRIACCLRLWPDRRTKCRGRRGLAGPGMVALLSARGRARRLVARQEGKGARLISSRDGRDHPRLYEPGRLRRCSTSAVRLVTLSGACKNWPGSALALRSAVEALLWRPLLAVEPRASARDCRRRSLPLTLQPQSYQRAAPPRPPHDAACAGGHASPGWTPLPLRG